jgi:hypothetical protein
MSIERLAEDLWQTSPVVEGDYELRLSYSGALRRAFDEVEWDHRLFPVASFAVSVDSDSAGDEGTIELGEIAGGSRSTVTGRLVFEGPGANGVVPSALPAMWLTDPRSGGPMIPFTDDGAFVLDGLAAGLYRFSPAPHFLSLPDGLFVSAVRSAGRSVLDEGLLVGGGANPVEIVISDGAARIEGIVRRGEGDLVPGARVILVPPAEGRGPITHFRNAPASATGFYELDGVSPGEYRVLALDLAGRTFGNPFWEDPAFLRQYELRGERITVDPGARLTINAEAIPLVD